MQIFYAPHIENGVAVLDEEESRHLLTVLRHPVGAVLHLSDGQGRRFTAELIEAGKKQAVLRVLSELPGLPPPPFHLHVGISPIKNMERFEWFLEKATELGGLVVGATGFEPVTLPRQARDALNQLS